MKNETKLLKVKKWFDENGIAWKSRAKHRNGHSDCFVIETKVSIKIEGKDDWYFYETHKRGYHPVFIRKSDTPRFVIDKVSNAILASMIEQQRTLMKRKYE